MKFVRRALAILASTALATAATPTFSASSNAGFTVNVTVANSCTVAFSASSAATINYTGTTGAAVDTSLPFTTSCTGTGIPYSLALTNAAGAAQITDTFDASASGVTYTLELRDAVANNAASLVHPTGHASADTYNSTTAENNLRVRVTATANQAATCTGASCSVTNSHSVVMSY